MPGPNRVRHARIRVLERGGAAAWLQDRSSGWVYYTWQWVLGPAARHPRTTGAVLVFWFVWGSVGLAAAVLLFGVLSAALWMAWVALRRTEGSPGGSPKASVEDVKAKAALRKQWPLACRAAKLLGADAGEVPKLAKLASNGHGTLTATVQSGRIGVPVSRVVKAAPDLADVVGCREVVVSEKAPGVAELAFHWRDVLGRLVTLADLPASPEGHLTYGIRADGTAASFIATQSVLIGGLTRHGKALALDTVVPTPDGFTTMGDLRVGQEVFSETGEVCTVTDAWDVRYDRPCYRVTFSDGTTVVADEDHQWLVDTAKSRQSAATAAKPKQGGKYSRDQSGSRSYPEVLTTGQMLTAGVRRENLNQRANYSVDLALPLQAADADLPIPAYTLGSWLGDGHSKGALITSADPELLLEIEAEGVVVERRTCGPYLYALSMPGEARPSQQKCEQCENLSIPGQVRCSAHMAHKIPCSSCGEPARAWRCRACGSDTLPGRLRRLGVFGNKHIPAAYLRASEGQRRALLAGLLDTDGYCSKAGQIQYYSTNERLARDVFHLVASLGYKPGLRSKTARLEGRDCGLVWIVGFTASDKVFRLQRKLERQVLQAAPNTRRRYIVSIEPVESVPVRCVAVDAPSHLFLVTEACIPTHNSNFTWAALGDAISQGMFVDLYVSDPKGGVELDALEAALDASGGMLRVREYAKTPAETVKMLERTEKAMHARQYWMKQNGTRKVQPSEENPLVLSLLDETLPLTELLKKGTDSPLGRIAYTGSAAAYTILANTQVGQVDALGRFRDLVPQRVCFATGSPTVTDAVLGTGAEGMGALCSKITEPGRGFSYNEGDRRFRAFKAAYVSDDEARLIAAGQLPPKVVNARREAYDRKAELSTASKSRKDRRTALYRWYYIDHPEHMNELGYVGISYDVVKRESQHSAALREFMEGNVRREVVWFETRPEAEAAEKLAIQLEKPIHNVQHNGGSKRRFSRSKVAA